MNKNKILLAIDGSGQAMSAVRYISALVVPQKTKIVLFHVGCKYPETFLDLNVKPKSGMYGEVFSAWLIHGKRTIEEFMDNATSILTDAGFSYNDIAIQIQKIKKGIARDIIAESWKGYKAIVIGRTGGTDLKDAQIGSVAYKVIESIKHLPVAVIGGNPETQKALIAFDGSEGAMRAADCVCCFMANGSREVALCHVVRSLNIHFDNMRIFNTEQEKKWITSGKKNIEPKLKETELRLTDAGFHPSLVYREFLENKRSRAEGIKQVATSDGAGTIVLGRHGHSEVSEFIMGRVCRKVLSMADAIAVWIV